MGYIIFVNKNCRSRDNISEGGTSEMKTVFLNKRKEDYKPTILVSITVPETFF